MMRLFRLALVALALLVVGCRSSSESSGGGESLPAGETLSATTPATAAPGDVDASDATAAREPAGTPPQPVGAWPQRYQAQLRADAVLVGMLRPQAVSGELERALQALSQVDATSEARVRRALADGLGDLVELVEPSGWAERGFDADAHIIVQLTTGEGSGIEPAAARVAEALASDAPAAALAAHRQALEQSGFGLRVALPVVDADAALAFLRRALPTIPATPVDGIAGYEAVYAVGGRTLVGLARADGFVLVDTAFEPWLDEAHAEAQLGLQRRILEGLGAAAGPPPAPGLPGPRKPDGASAFFAVDLARLGRLDAVALLATAGAAPTDAQLAVARLSEALLQRGPYRALGIELGPGSGVAVSAYFARRHEALAQALSARPAVRVEGALGALGFSPVVMAQDGPWIEAGLGADPALELGTLVQALDQGGGVLPLLVPVWMTSVPALVWRDLVPAPARFFKPGALERIELVVGPELDEDNPAVAMMLLDAGGELETHRHGLACLSQRRPVQGRCRDGEIELGKRATTRIGTRELHYLIEERELDGVAHVVLIASPDAALFQALADAQLEPGAALGHVRIDLERLATSGVAPLLGTAVGAAATLLGSLEADVQLDADGLHWQARFGRDASLAHVAAVVAPAFLEYLERGKEVEAVIHLEALAVGAVAWRDRADGGDGRAYPAAGQPSCTEGGRLDGQRVETPDALWQASPWRELGFRIELPHLYRYCYQSAADGSHFAAWAEASLEGATRDSRWCVLSELDATGEAVVGQVRRLEGEQGCFVAAAP